MSSISTSTPINSAPVMISSSEWHDEDYDILAEALFDEAPIVESSSSTPTTVTPSQQSTLPTSTTTPAVISSTPPPSVEVPSATTTSAAVPAVVSPVSSSVNLMETAHASTTPVIVKESKLMTTIKEEEETSTTTTTTDVATKKQRVESSTSAVVTATATQTTTAPLKHKKTGKPTPVPIAPAVPKPPSKALQQFLKAASVAAQESKAANGNSSPLLEMTAAEQVEFRRERNRCLAKQTRQRKKVQMTALKQQLQVLHSEHERLTAIVQQHVLPASAILQNVDASLQQIPKAVWDATGINRAGATDDNTPFASSSMMDVDDDASASSAPESTQEESAKTTPAAAAPVVVTTTTTPASSEVGVSTPASAPIVMTPSDEDSMLLMKILKSDDHHHDDVISAMDETPVATTTCTTTTLPPLPMSTITDDEHDTSSLHPSEASEDSAAEAVDAILPPSQEEFSIPNPLAALVDVPETTAPAQATSKPAMTLFGKPVALSG